MTHSLTFYLHYEEDALPAIKVRSLKARKIWQSRHLYPTEADMAWWLHEYEQVDNCIHGIDFEHEVYYAHQ